MNLVLSLSSRGPRMVICIFCETCRGRWRSLAERLTSIGSLEFFFSLVGVGYCVWNLDFLFF